MDENPYKAPQEDSRASHAGKVSWASYLVLAGIAWALLTAQLVGEPVSWAAIAEWFFFGVLTTVSAIKVLRRA